MCQKPNIINGVEVSCRECDHCAATYKNTWVARCMAEKSVMPYAYAITLTYADDENGEPPLGAKVYRYKDVADFWKRIRSAARRRWKEPLDMRYVVVGERGTRFGRCHYHGVIFASRPIIELGEMKSAKGGGFAFKRRLTWTTWGHGLVEFQPADRKGIAYCLKYILKARMTSERSKGFAREGKTEWLASSYLWCSKKPSIGATWLWRKLIDETDRGQCPPALRVRVPGGGDWYLSGKIQQDACEFLHLANERNKEVRGRDLAGWRTLVESVSEPIENLETGEINDRKAKEWLIHGEENHEEKIQTKEQSANEWNKFKDDYARKRRVAAPITNARATVRKCGNILPCEGCRRSIGEVATQSLEAEFGRNYRKWAETNVAGTHETDAEHKARFERWWQTRLRPSRGCALRADPNHRESFKRLVAVTKSQPRLQARKAVGGAL